MSHRPRRDTASNAKELDSLQKENRKLKRELAKLQKYVTKLLDRQSTVVPDDPAEEQASVPLPPTKDGVSCPTCQGVLTVIPIGVKILHCCKSCGWRKAF